MYILVFSVLIGVTVIAIGVIAYYFMQPSSKDNTGQVREHLSMPTDINKNSTLYLTYSSLQGKDYDKKFVPNAIAHYENAVNMLTLASASAKHQELKDFLNKINPELNIQLNSLVDLKKDLGSAVEADHDRRDVDHENSSVEGKFNSEAKLKKLTGDEFDKEFLRLMIFNFEDMVNMAASGQKNADQDKLKRLTKEIVDFNKEGMKQLHTWQMQWYGASM